MIVPELPEDVRALKEAVGRFVEAEVYPVEERIAERGSIDLDELAALRAKAREAGFAMLNMPAELGGRDLSMLGQVALEEESGKATNGLGFAVVDRGPRELHEIATPEQIERYVRPIASGEYREAWALTEPGAGSDLTGLAATAVRDGGHWVLNGEKWFVTSEGEPGVYIVLAVAEDEQTLFLVDPGTEGMEIRRTPAFLHDPYIDHHPEIVFRDCRVPDANRVPASGDAGAKEWILVERLFIAARCCGAALRLVDLTAGWAQEREAFGPPSPSTRASPSRSRIRSRSCTRRGSSPTTPPMRSTSSTIARSCTARCRWRSSTPPRWPGAWWTARCRRSVVAATWSRTLPPASIASCVSTASGRARARSSARSSPAASSHAAPHRISVGRKTGHPLARTSSRAKTPDATASRPRRTHCPNLTLLV